MITDAWLFRFLIVSGIGFLLSLVVHIMALADVPIPGGITVFVLHIGAILIWIPAENLSYQGEESWLKYVWNRTNKPQWGWSEILKHNPRWMKWVLNGLTFYAVFNFLIAFMEWPARSKIKTKSGDPVPALVVRAFSGHWMAFYGAAYAFLYSRLHMPKTGEDSPTDGEEDRETE